MIILAGDIGGTSSTFLLTEKSAIKTDTLFEHTYPSNNFESIFPLLEQFLNKDAQLTAPPKVACIAIAGPVQKNTAIVTNLPWVVSEQKLEEHFKIDRVKLINDFQAVGYGLTSLSDCDLETLQIGKLNPEGPKALIGAGTGLGEGIIVTNDGHTQILPSEGGRTDFAPRDEFEIELLQYLMHHKKRVACEAILSGKGLIRIFEFLRAKGFGKETPDLHQRLKTNDPAAEISAYALSGKDRLAELALNRFIKIYGALAGNLALTTLATGGVYIAGGIAPKIINKLKDGTFIESFNDNPKMSVILKNIPVHVILNTSVGLYGAQFIAETLSNNENST